MDVIVHVCNSTMFVMFVLLKWEVSLALAKVTMDFQPPITHLNQSMNITCTVEGIVNINREVTRQWSKGSKLICYNGLPIYPSKYTEILTHGNQFILQIKNVTESDVNCKFQCRYRFDTQAKRLQLSTKDVEYPPADEVRAIVHYNQSERLLTVNLHFKKISPLPRCIGIIEGTTSLFNLTSSKNFGSYYDVVLRHQSTDKLYCNGEVIVKCTFIKEYNISIEDHRKCSSEENDTTEVTQILLGTCSAIVLLIVLVILGVSLLRISKRKKKKNDVEISSTENTKSANVITMDSNIRVESEISCSKETIMKLLPSSNE